MTSSTAATPALAVSVVIPAFNRAGMIDRAVRSALGQRPHPPAEVLVVDDCSTDDTAALAERAGATVIRLEANGGAAGARNAGIAAAAQPWVAFLDSDDEWLPDHLDRLHALSADHVLVASTALMQDDDGRLVGIAGSASGRPLLLRSPTAVVWPENVVPASGMMARTSVLRSVGGFRQGIRLAEDFDLVLRLLERGTGLVAPEIGVTYHHHAGGKSRRRDDAWASQERILAGYEQAGWWSPRQARRRGGVHAWDRLRASLRSGDRRVAARQAARLLVDPQMVVGVGGALLWRAGKRRRMRTMTAR